jgi:hypothetical protein
MTLDQLEESAQAPWTSTIVGLAAEGLASAALAEVIWRGSSSARRGEYQDGG